MANYGGPHWALPQDAALQAQQAYQAHAVGMTMPAGTTAAGMSIPYSVTPPPSSSSGDGVVSPLIAAGGIGDVHRNNRMAGMEDKVLVTRTADEETEDGRIRNKEAMAKIRDAWVYKQIRARVDEFTEYKQVRRY